MTIGDAYGDVDSLTTLISTAHLFRNSYLMVYSNRYGLHLIGVSSVSFTLC